MEVNTQTISSNSTVKSLKKGDIKKQIQKVGNFLSGMMMPNIGAFIAWGLITAFFIPTGWWPNAALAQLVDPMLFYLLPLLVSISGGKIIYGARGSIIAAITMMGVIVSTTIPMFLGAMIVAPLSAWIMKKVDYHLQPKIKPGFEMLINNFSIGILGMLLAIFSYYFVGPAIQSITVLLAEGTGWLVDNNLLPVTSVIVEPAKIFFLNNAINFGVFAPLGFEQAAETGKSIYFMVESNPGPGLGVLIAFALVGPKSTRKTALGAAIIVGIGGIHEVYFPYVMMKPVLLISLIAGGAIGVLTNSIMGAGLIAPPSPGSIIAFYTFTATGLYWATTLGMLTAFGATFAVAFFLLKFSRAIPEAKDLLSAAKDEVVKLKQASKGNHVGVANTTDGDIFPKVISNIVVACDAGMGSSALGASILKKKVTKANLPIVVTNSSISNLKDGIDLVITQKNLIERTIEKTPNSIHVVIDNFVDNVFYDNLVSKLERTINPVKGNISAEDNIIHDLEIMTDKISSEIDHQKVSRVKEKQIYLGLSSVSKDEAIRMAGHKLEENGFVKKDYYLAMLKREEIVSTFMGNGVAIPHAVEEAKNEVIKSGIVILQFPHGIDFGDGNTAYILIGLAASGNDHLDTIAALADILQDEQLTNTLAQTNDVDLFIKAFK